MSLLCTKMDPHLRAVAEMGAWQVISPGQTPITGQVVVVPDLRDVQLDVYPPNTVMVCDQVSTRPTSTYTNWQEVFSYNKYAGQVVVVPDPRDVRLDVFPPNTVMVCDVVGVADHARRAARATPC